MNRNDFEKFERSENVNPPEVLSERILSSVRSDLNPSGWKVFSKLSLIHFLTALVTLSMCPQFGIRLLGNGMGLMAYFMRFGDSICGLACGFFFLGSSMLVAMLVLRREEIRVIRGHRTLELGALTLLSLGFFIMAHAEIVLGFALAWIAGAVFGGILTLELAWGVRLWLLRAH